MQVDPSRSRRLPRSAAGCASCSIAPRPLPTRQLTPHRYDLLLSIDADPESMSTLIELHKSAHAREFRAARG
jgi:hypothetical protein